MDGLRKTYVNISLPKELIGEIDRLVASDPARFKSRAELVRQAIAEHMKELAAWDEKRNGGKK
ncbi:ribbon-helix-helix protein, CopG family [Candidatus Woesearchaeota archaeon]|nr:ribbon-helix-helix protein, CopG family [Candidatus Woesearchaeota archaeon]